MDREGSGGVGEDATQRRVLDRRNELLALWAAGRMKLKGPAAIGYARGIVSDRALAEESRLVDRIRADLAAAGEAKTEDAVRQELRRLTRVATLEFGGTPERDDGARDDGAR